MPRELPFWTFRIAHHNFISECRKGVIGCFQEFDLVVLCLRGFRGSSKDFEFIVCKRGVSRFSFHGSRGFRGSRGLEHNPLS